MCVQVFVHIGKRNSQLAYLTIENLRLPIAKNNCERWKFVLAFVRMLQKQNNLSSVSLRGLNLPARDVGLVICTLHHFSGACLRRLDSVNAMTSVKCDKGRKNFIRHAWLVSFVPELPLLQHLCLNFEYLTSLFLSKLSQGCFHLEVISIEVFSTSRRRSDISTSDWQMLMTQLPHLTVHVTVHDRPSYEFLKPHLPYDFILHGQR